MGKSLTSVEKVWVVPRPVVEEYVGGPAPGLWQGALPPFIELQQTLGLFMDRPQAEEDPAYLQIIPYIMLTQGTAIFTVTRLQTQGEQRLHGKVSVGIGGHLNPEDGEPPFWGGFWRELEEEVGLPQYAGELHPLGIILEDHNPVSRVHCGIAWRLELPAGTAVEIAEPDKMQGGWARLSEIQALFERLETWSQRLIEHVAATSIH